MHHPDLVSRESKPWSRVRCQATESSVSFRIETRCVVVSGFTAFKLLENTWHPSFQLFRKSRRSTQMILSHTLDTFGAFRSGAVSENVRPCLDFPERRFVCQLGMLLEFPLYSQSLYVARNASRTIPVFQCDVVLRRALNS